MLKAYSCEAEEEYHEATADPQTGMCPYCTAPPQPLAAPVPERDR